MLPPKESILWRKQTKPSIKNVQSAEKIAQAEQLRLQARQTKLAMLTESRRVALYSSPQEKAHAQRTFREEGELLQIQARMKKKEERKRDIREGKEYMALSEMLAGLEQQRESRRREQLRTAQEHNRRVILSKSAEKVTTKVREDSRDRRMIEEHLRSHTPNVL